jgi:hypothetical protein
MKQQTGGFSAAGISELDQALPAPAGLGYRRSRAAGSQARAPQRLPAQGRAGRTLPRLSRDLRQTRFRPQLNKSASY